MTTSFKGEVTDETNVPVTDFPTAIKLLYSQTPRSDTKIPHIRDDVPPLSQSQGHERERERERERQTDRQTDRQTQGDRSAL